MAEAKYHFLYIDVGVNGRVSDGEVFKQSDLARAIDLNTLNIPRECRVKRTASPICVHRISTFTKYSETVST